jgi:energy-coupling factor transporter ATP-binding protein EcfA2
MLTVLRALPHFLLGGDYIREEIHWTLRRVNLGNISPEATSLLASAWLTTTVNLGQHLATFVEPFSFNDGNCMSSVQIIGGIIDGGNLRHIDDAINRIVNEMSIPGKSAIVLCGPAGSGKTTVVSSVARIIGNRQRITLTAPTHKAVRVMREMIGDPMADCRTTHSALGFAFDDKNPGRLKRRPIVKAGPKDVLVIDEASMVDSDILGVAMGSYNKIILVGDPFQFPPINERTSPAFELPDQIYLDKILRQEDDELAWLVSKVRDAVIGDDIEIYESIKSLVPHADNLASDGKGNIVIAYTNEYVEYANSFTGNVVQAGDVLIAMESFRAGHHVVRNSDLLDVASVDDDVVAYGIKGRKVITACGKKMVVPDSYNNMIRICDGLKSKGGYGATSALSKIKALYSPVRKANAITAHKSQGSTYDHVTVAVDDLMACRDPLRALYVAVSRARKSVSWC